MSIDTDQMWVALRDNVKTKLFFLFDENDETVVKEMVPVIVEGFENFALLGGKDQRDLGDVKRYVADFWENIRFPRLLRLRDEITEAMIQKFKQILQERNNSS